MPEAGNPQKNYQQALSDFEERGWDASLHTVEIGSLGHWIQSSQISICQAVISISKRNAKEILDCAAAKVISASEILFRARLNILDFH